MSRGLILSAGALFLFLFIGGCRADDAPAPTVLSQLIAHPQLSNFSQLVLSAGDVAATLNDPTTLVTLFAPTNAAMDKLTRAEWQRLQADKHNGCLHHTLYGDILTTVLKPTQKLETLSGDLVVITRNLSTSVVHIAAALVTTKDIIASNGVLDIIDKVLLPGGPTPAPVTPTPAPVSPTPGSPTPAPPSVCTGKSADLAAVDCGAWQDLHDATNGPKWNNCSDARSDPCSCDGGGGYVGCKGGHITTIGLFENNLRGTIPSSLAKLSKMAGLFLAHNRLTGLLPPLPFAQYNGSGVKYYYACQLDDPSGCTEPNCNHFTCPLPAGSEQCKYGTIPGVHCK